jgi:DNA-binding NtrC family response regulator
MEIQGKLLRILQEGEYTPVGKTKSRKVNVRFIAATNQNLRDRVKDGAFRKDLLYRLQFAHLHLPPLRERVEDILLLAAGFLASSGRPGVKVSEDAEAALMQHDWQGNVRELKGVLEASSNLAESGEIGTEHLKLPKPNRIGKPVQRSGEVVRVGPLADVEKDHILAVYHAMGRNKTATARVLEIGLQTLRRRLKAYNEDD